MRRDNEHRDLQLPLAGHAVPAAAQLLRRHHIYPHLHDRLRLLDVLLAGPQVRPGQADTEHKHHMPHSLKLHFY